MIENVSTQLTVFHCFAHCLLPGRAFASLYVLLFLEKEAEIIGRVCSHLGPNWSQKLQEQEVSKAHIPPAVAIRGCSTFREKTKLLKIS